MKILVTFFCCFIFGLLVLFATVDLEPYLTPENPTVKKSAVDSSSHEMATTAGSDPLPAQRAENRVENLIRDGNDMSASEQGLSRITTHQLIVTEKRDNENFGHTTKIRQRALPLADDNVSAPDSEQPGQ